MLAEFWCIGFNALWRKRIAHNATHLLVLRRVHINNGVTVDVIDHVLVVFHGEGGAGCGGEECWIFGHSIHFCDPCDHPIGHPGDGILQLNDRARFADFCKFAVGHTISVSARVE